MESSAILSGDGHKDAIEEVFSRYALLSFRKGELIIRPNENLRGINYLKKGLVQQYVISNRGEVLVIHTFKPGAFFPMIWAVNPDVPLNYYYEALGNVEIYRAPRDEVMEFIKNRPALLLDFSARLLKGLFGLSQRMESLVLTPAKSRIISLFLYLSKSYGRKVKEGTLITIPLTHRDIAAWVGTTRETVSIEVKQLENRGLVLYHKHSYIVPDLTKFEKELTYLLILALGLLINGNLFDMFVG